MLSSTQQVLYVYISATCKSDKHLVRGHISLTHTMMNTLGICFKVMDSVLTFLNNMPRRLEVVSQWLYSMMKAYAVGEAFIGCLTMRHRKSDVDI